MTLLKTLTLSGFRNYTQLSFSPVSRNLIVGSNGQGKTNLLEALVLVAGGRSFRPALPESLVQEGGDQAFLSAEVVQEHQTTVLSLCLDRSGRKQFFLNGKSSRSSSLAQELPILLFSPESLSLLKGSADKRRVYIDEWLSMLGYSVVVREFNKVLVQKNRFLKEARLSLAPFSEALWESINTLFIEKSLKLSEMREKALEELSSFLQQTGAFLFTGTELRLAYERRGLSGGSLSEKEALFKAQVWGGASKERLAGVSLYGAQRDDFVLSLDGQDSRYFCSQGQQRGLIIALKMAQVLWFHCALSVSRVRDDNCFRGLSNRCGTSPLLLLDDIFSEIDHRLLLNVLQFLEELPVQTILTSTREPLFLNKGRFKTFYLKDGVFLKENPNGHSQRKAYALL